MPILKKVPLKWQMGEWHLTLCPLLIIDQAGAVLSQGGPTKEGHNSGSAEIATRCIMVFLYWWKMDEWTFSTPTVVLLRRRVHCNRQHRREALYNPIMIWAEVALPSVGLFDLAIFVDSLKTCCRHTHPPLISVANGAFDPKSKSNLRICERKIHTSSQNVRFNVTSGGWLTVPVWCGIVTTPLLPLTNSKKLGVGYISKHCIAHKKWLVIFCLPLWAKIKPRKHMFTRLIRSTIAVGG